MKCIECGDRFYQGEVMECDGGVMCWTCAAYVAQQGKQEARAMDEEEAFRTLSINELVSAGYISAATMNELFAPWSEVEEFAIAA
jgi:DNA-directed RNA polymerase subunit RPC12/RpoP